MSSTYDIERGVRFEQFVDAYVFCNKKKLTSSFYFRGFFGVGWHSGCPNICAQALKTFWMSPLLCFCSSGLQREFNGGNAT